MHYHTERALFEPGAVTSGTHIAMPTNAAPIYQIQHAELWGATHAHTSLTIKNSEAAADATAFVDLYDGTGTLIATGTKVGAAGGGADESVSSSSVAGMVLTAATATLINSATITLSVTTKAGDILSLDYLPAGAVGQI